MASETIFGYFGKKGAGKTHELVKVVIDHLRKGRYVVAGIPSLDVEKVAIYLDDETVKNRLVVFHYEEVTDNPKFWPDEKLIRNLQLWKRGDSIPVDSANWRESVVIPGCVVVLDEAWRWLHSRKDLEKSPGMDAALRMARHWQGPADWSKPELVQRYTSNDWFPSMGGPSFEELLDKSGNVTRIERGGDGTQMSTTNILFASQDFFALDRTLRSQIDQTTLLVALNDRNFPRLLKKATNGIEQYNAYTFESCDMPTRRQMIQGVDKGDKLWLTQQTHNHEKPVHDLYSYSAGYAKESAVDDNSSLKHNPNFKKFKQGIYILGFMLLFVIGAAIYGVYTLKSSDIMHSKTKVASTESLDPANLPDVKEGKLSTSIPSTDPIGKSSRQDDRPVFAGRIGSAAMLQDGNKFVTVKTISDHGRWPEGLAYAGMELSSETDISGSTRGSGSPATSGGSSTGFIGASKTVTGVNR